MFFLLWLVGSAHFIPAGIGYGFIPLYSMPQILVNTEGAGPLPHGLECGQCARLWGLASASRSWLWKPCEPSPGCPLGELLLPGVAGHNAVLCKALAAFPRCAWDHVSTLPGALALQPGWCLEGSVQPRDLLRAVPWWLHSLAHQWPGASECQDEGLALEFAFTCSASLPWQRHGCLSPTGSLTRPVVMGTEALASSAAPLRSCDAAGAHTAIPGGLLGHRIHSPTAF